MKKGVFPQLADICSTDPLRPHMQMAVVYGDRIWATNAHVAISIPTAYFIYDEKQRENINYKAIHRDVIKEISKTTHKAVTFTETDIVVTKRGGEEVRYPYYAAGVHTADGAYVALTKKNGVVKYYLGNEKVEGFTRTFVRVDENREAIRSEKEGNVTVLTFPAIEAVIPTYGRDTVDTHSHNLIGLNPELLAKLSRAFASPIETVIMYMPKKTADYPTRAVVVHPYPNDDYSDEIGIIMPVTL